MSEELTVLDQRQGNLAMAYRAAVQRQEERVRHLRYEADQEEAVLEAMRNSLEQFMHGYRL
jgi:predicted RNase H-like nuclease (RuvC/YqgF family)